MRFGKDCGSIDGRIFKLHEHLARLRRSAEALAFPEIPADEKIIDEIKRTLIANKMRDGVHIRLTLTRGRQDHLRHGPAPESIRADFDRPGGT